MNISEDDLSLNLDATFTRQSYQSEHALPTSGSEYVFGINRKHGITSGSNTCILNASWFDLINPTNCSNLDANPGGERKRSLVFASIIVAV